MIFFYYDFMQDVEVGFYVFQDIVVEEVVFWGEFKDFYCYFSDIVKCIFVIDDDVVNVWVSCVVWYVFNMCYGVIS